MSVVGYLFPLLGVGSYIFALVFNYLAIAGNWFGDLDVGEISDKYQVSITPAGWTFGIWGIIYTWQALWLIYVTYLSLKAINRGTLYFTRLFWIAYIAANVLNGIWIAVWISEDIILASVFLIFIFVTLVITGFSSHRWLVYEVPLKLARNGTESELDQYPQSLVLSLMNGKNGNGSQKICCCNDEKQVLYALVLNGVAVYATWTAVASCINLSVFFKYTAKCSNNVSVGIGLTVLIVIIASYWFCDLFKFRNTLRFTFTPYFVLIWAFSGVLSKYPMDNEKTEGSSIIVFILLLCACVASVAKVFVSVSLIKRDNDSTARPLMQQEKV